MLVEAATGFVMLDDKLKKLGERWPARFLCAECFSVFNRIYDPNHLLSSQSESFGTSSRFGHPEACSTCSCRPPFCCDTQTTAARTARGRPEMRSNCRAPRSGRRCSASGIFFGPSRAVMQSSFGDILGRNQLRKNKIPVITSKKLHF